MNGCCVYLVVDSTALGSDIAQALADRSATFATRHGTKLFNGDGVVAELGSAHKGSGRSLPHIDDSAVLHLIGRRIESRGRSRFMRNDGSGAQFMGWGVQLIFFLGGPARHHGMPYDIIVTRISTCILRNTFLLDRFLGR